MGKSATAHLIASATQVYSGHGYKYVLLLRMIVDHIRFYYAHERKANGAPVYDAIDGRAHGEFYVQLSEGEKCCPWLATFVKNVGYVDFAKGSSAGQ